MDPTAGLNLLVRGIESDSPNHSVRNSHLTFLFPCGPPSLMSKGSGGYSPGIAYESDHLPKSTAEVKNVWNLLPPSIRPHN
jgi:hypothetical protein